MSSWTVAHDSRYFHDPMVFKPERWLDPDCKDLKEASQPFSLGPRACIGRKSVSYFLNSISLQRMWVLRFANIDALGFSFAYAQMSLELAKILFRYDMELVDTDLDYEADCRMHFMWWKPDLYIRFSERSSA